MQWINLYDGNNYFRRELESNSTGTPATSILARIQSDSNPTVFVWDPPNGLANRRAIWPAYKTNRSPVREDIYASISYFKEILKHTKTIQVEVSGFEADDVIASLAKKHAGDGVGVAIYTNDYDFMQLTTNPNIICGATKKDGVRPELVRLYKTWVGDPSDNIPGVKGFGETAWERARGFTGTLQKLVALSLQLDTGFDQLAEYQKQVNSLEANKSVKKWLMDNPKLLATFYKVISFMNVPEDLIDAGTTVGIPNENKINELLRDMMWLPMKKVA